MQGVKKTEFLYIFACIFYVFLAFLSVFRYIFVALSFWRGHFLFHADRRMHFPAFHRTDQIQNCQDSRISCKNSLACHRTKRGITDQHKNIREKNSVGQHCPGHKAAQQTTERLLVFRAAQMAPMCLWNLYLQGVRSRLICTGVFQTFSNSIQFCTSHPSV